MTVRLLTRTADMQVDIYLPKLSCETITYHFNKTLRFCVKFDRGMWTFTNRDLGFVSLVKAEQFDEALCGLASDFHSMYQYIVREREDKLTSNALALKRKLLEVTA